MPKRCFMPPEKLPRRRLARLEEVGLLEQRCTTSRRASPRRVMPLSAGEVIEQVVRGHLRVDAELLRQVPEQLADAAPCRASTSMAARRPRSARPASASWSVASVRISVDLPAPLGPSRPNMPAGMVSETSSSAWTPLA